MSFRKPEDHELTRRRLENVLFTGQIVPMRKSEVGQVVSYVLTEEANGYQIWLAIADSSIPDERGVDYTPAGQGWFAYRDVAIEAAVERTVRARDALGEKGGGDREQ